MRRSSDLVKKHDAAATKSSSYRAEPTGVIASNPPAYWARDTHIPAETVAFLGDRETPCPLLFEGTTTASTRDSEECKKPVAALSDSSVRTSYDVEDNAPILMGQTFQSLVDKDIPDFVRQHNTALSFPHKLMLMLMHLEKVAAKTGKKPTDLPMGWLDDGLAFVIRDKEKLVSDWLPIFFKHTKFASFTRKLYRWQFRQVISNSLHERSNSLFFGHPNFQRDKKSLLVNMCSVTADTKRRKEAAAQEQRRLSEQQSTTSMAVGSHTFPHQLQGQVRSSSLVPELGAQLPFQVVSSTMSLATLNLQRLLQQQELANRAQAQAQLLQQLLASRQASLQQTEANASIGQLLVAILAAYGSAESGPQKQPPTQPSSQEQQLQRLLNLLHDQNAAGSNQFRSLPFPPPSPPSFGPQPF